MRFFTSIFFLFASLVGLAQIAQSAGSGGGGGGGSVTPPPVCDADTWSCAAWSDCGLDGVEHRSCELTFNCPTAQTPRPTERQACTPSCNSDAWECTAWSDCATDGRQFRSCVLHTDCPLTQDPMPFEEQPCQANCTADQWACADFGACQNGVRQRTCRQTLDCPAAVTPAPATSEACAEGCTATSLRCGDWNQCQFDGYQRRSCELPAGCALLPADTLKALSQRPCPGLRCGQLSTLDERISCRLALTTEEAAEEFSILYFPEYCRVTKTIEERQACIVLYQQLGAFWQQTDDANRATCARQVIGLRPLEQEQQICQQLAGDERIVCVRTLKDKIEQLIIFHLYELEVKAETLLAQNRVRLSDVAALETFVEIRKQQLDAAETLSAWRLLIWQVRQEWESFTLKLL